MKSRDQRGSLKREKEGLGRRDHGGSDRGRGNLRLSPRALRTRVGPRLDGRATELWLQSGKMDQNSSSQGEWCSQGVWCSQGEWCSRG